MTTITTTPTGRPPRVNPGTISAEILEVLAFEGRPMTTSEIARAIPDASMSAVRRSLHRHAQRGWIARAGKHTYHELRPAHPSWNGLAGLDYWPMAITETTWKIIHKPR